MSNKAAATVLMVIGWTQSIWPNMDGWLYTPPPITAGEGRIIGAIFVVGAFLVWFMPTPKDQ